MDNVTEPIDHNKVRQYLVGNGWQKQPDVVEGSIEKYQKNLKEVELVVQKNLPTYKSYLEGTLQSLSLFENAPVKDIMEKVATVGLLKFSVIVGDGTGAHRIRMNESTRLRSDVEMMFLAISHSELTAAITHSRLSKQEAQQFIGECFEDQTKASSYKANFLVPDRKFEQLSGAIVVKKVETAIAMSKIIANREILPASNEYQSLAEKGISTNFLAALSDFKGIGGSDKIRFVFNDVVETELSTDELTNIHDFYTEIVRPSTEIKTVFGDMMAKSYAPEHTVTLESNIDGKMVTIKVKISADNYKDILFEESELANVAGGITNRPRLKITGKLRKRSRGGYEIAEVDELEIVKRIP